MNEETPFDAWQVETTDLTARVAAAIGAVPPPVERELFEELRALRREIAELRGTTALLQDEVARLRLSAPIRRIVPFGPAEGLVRLS
ncbi:hypothetical protein EON82_21540 [bacterium]|nr:MAG: hypothetical protein EON82_21540 [bacterium]